MRVFIDSNVPMYPDRARDLVRDRTPASVRGLIHAAVMRNNDVTSVASFDGGFDHVKGIERLPLG